MTKSIRRKHKRLKKQTPVGNPHMKCSEARRRVREKEILSADLKLIDEMMNEDSNTR